LIKATVSFLLTIVLLLSAQSNTNDYVTGEVILKKNQHIYFDKGRVDGVAIGHKFDIIFDGRYIGNGIVSWVGDDLSYASVDSLDFYKYYYSTPLEVKILLEKPAQYEGGTLNLPFYQALKLQPAEIYTPNEMTVANLIYDGLVRLDSQGNIAPGLAHSWEVHGNTYTFYLNSNIKFHSGKPFDALDVVYSLIQLAKSPVLTPASSFITQIDGYEKVRFGGATELPGVFVSSRHTIAITTKDAFTPFLKYLASAGGFIIPVVQDNQRLPLPIGTGPFRIASIDGRKIKLSAYTDYFDIKAVLDSIIFSLYDSREEAALDFELGRLDLFYFDSENERSLLRQGDYTARRYYTNSAVVLGINCSHNYQKGYKLTKAMQYLIDTESIIRVLLNNSAMEIKGLLPEKLGVASGYTTDYYFSPDEATSMIENIEYLPEQFNLVYDELDPSLKQIAEYLAGQIRQIGFKITITGIDPRKIKDEVDISSLDMYLMRYDSPAADPDAYFTPIFSSQLSGQTNYLYYPESDKVDRYLSGARRLEDKSSRFEIYADLEQNILEKPPLVALYNPVMTVAHRKDLAGFSADLRSFINLRNTYFRAGN